MGQIVRLAQLPSQFVKEQKLEPKLFVPLSLMSLPSLFIPGTSCALSLILAMLKCWGYGASWAIGQWS